MYSIIPSLKDFLYVYPIFMHFFAIIFQSALQGGPSILVNMSTYRKELCTFATGILPKTLDPSKPGLPIASTKFMTVQETMKLL